MIRTVMTATAILTVLCLALPTGAQDKQPPLGKPDKDGFISLFNGKDLTGWVGSVKGYDVEDGVMFCKPRGGGNLFFGRAFSNFILTFDVKIPKGGNNGLAIRAPLKGNPAYASMELQILDNKAPQYAKLKPCQYHGSVYCVVPAKRGFQKPAGEWNHQEVRAIGSKITVLLNGTTIVDADLAAVRKAGKGHAGLERKTGHVGWLGHGSKVEFRNIRIKCLPDDAGQAPGALEDTHNTPPKGFLALFNGKDVTGWKGLVGSPKSRAKMTPEQLSAAQKGADEGIRKHWKAKDGVLVFDGEGGPLCTAKDYGDFEMFVDWKIRPGGDSGIYLRGSPQVQIWQNSVGSGGLYNNQKNPSKPLVVADNAPGKWNRFRIKMIGERVWVWLNGKKVVDNTILENYWEPKKPIYPTGQIELQNHGATLWFRNVYLREIPRESLEK